MAELLQVLFIALAIAGVGTCAGCGDDIRAEEVKHESERIEHALDVGELRLFGPAGPRAALSDEFYKPARLHPRSALPLIQKRLGSSDSLVRANAYDFLLHLRDDGQVGTEARQLLGKASEDSSSMVRTFVSSQQDESRSEQK